MTVALEEARDQVIRLCATPAGVTHATGERAQLSM